MIDEKDNNNLDSQLQENADKESTIEENQLQGENSPSDAQISDNQEEIQSKVDKKSEHEVIHKKDGRLHIYIRQDKYKGELKSKNWVGRLYIEGKQKISSSGTPNLEEAIPILEKWFDELQLEKNENIPVKEQFIEQNQENNPKNDAVIPTTKENNDVVSAAPISEVSKVAMQEPTKGVAISMLEKLKNFKFSKSKNNNSTSEEVAGEDKNQKTKENKLKKVFQNFFQSKVSKLSVAGEEIAGLDMTREAIRVAQVSQDKDEKWILDKYEEILQSGGLIQGKHVGDFEKDVCQMFNVKNAVATTSCGTGLETVLIASGIKGKRFIVPTQTFAASVNCIIRTGNTPLIVDVDSETQCLSLDIIKKSMEEAGQGAIGNKITFVCESILRRFIIVKLVWQTVPVHPGCTASGVAKLCLRSTSTQSHGQIGKPERRRAYTGSRWFWLGLRKPDVGERGSTEIRVNMKWSLLRRHVWRPPVA
mgnify:CR=1 FL=1